ncbi:extracellular solute-binding protein [Amaricoccus solimangrovi]|uniref:ABC transporter substrate-binding protein n=1 Tax=Amaricoccus solimangrovi TaxID=2589815 RepID=A0A501WWK9_9RHOB|nr:extracellular solute-binding protein [Amaricoccus solimangrovi]TPE53659.1 ABC transporter substrate-binding protein [Amaricoccus solimangrovi]
MTAGPTRPPLPGVSADPSPAGTPDDRAGLRGTRRGMLGLAAGLALGAAFLSPEARAEETAAAETATAETAGGGTIIRSHGISTFGDLKYPPDFAHFDFVNPDAPKGGTMVFRGTGASKTFDSLNSFILKGEPAQGLGLLYDSLLTGAPDEPDASYGLIARGIEYPEDRSWVIFDMRPEAKFSDGAPITAEDVVFTYDALMEKGQPSYQITLRDIASVEALDPHRVKFTFRPGVPSRDLPAMVGGLAILPKHYYDEVDFGESTMTPPVGSGQYHVENAQPGRSIRYCRNPDYWGKDLPVNIGSSNFDCYQYEYYGDDNAAFEAFKVGDYQFHQEFYSALWATGYNFPAMDEGWVKREEIPDNTPSGTQGFWFNLRREKFQDPRVREAIGLMFNFEWTNATLFYGLYQRTDSFFENSPMQAEGVAGGEELAVLEPFRDRLPPEIFTEPPYTPPVSGEQQIDRSALRRASKLLDEAGWPVGKDGLRRDARGATLGVEFVDDAPTFERIINPYVANLRRIGVDARFSRIDAAQMQQRLKTFDYDIIPTRFVMSMSPSIELREIFGSAAANAQGTANLTGLADPVVDALIEQVIAAKSREELDARAQALDRVLRSKQIWVPNWYSGKFLIAYWDIYGRPDQPPPYSRGDAFWWFDQAKFDKLRAQGALR